MFSAVSKLRVFAFALALLSLMALGSGLAFGQAVSGNVVGTVTDSSGAAVVNADATATNVATGVAVTAKTGSTGEYRFDNLPAGSYRIAVKSSGFRTTTVNVEILLNQTGTANVTLSPGASTETIEVSGEAPIIDTSTAQLQNTYQEKQLLDLPTTGLGVSPNGQNLGVLNLSLLEAGVGSSGGLGAGTGPSIGGQRPRNNNFVVEGIDNNDKGVTGPVVNVPNDAVQEFSTLQNQYSPEFGHSTGGQFNVAVLGGTNTFHGRAYEYLQNRKLNAIDIATVRNTAVGVTPSNPRFDNNRYGGQLGGPIFKNKLFFFANYEVQPIGQATQPPSALILPTAAGYATLSAVTGVNTTSIAQLQKYAVAPSPCTVITATCHDFNVGEATIQGGNLGVVAPNFSNTKALVTSMDYNLSDRDQIRGRYIYNKTTAVDTNAALPVFYTTVPVSAHLVTLAEFHDLPLSALIRKRTHVHLEDA